jgi:predicted branched-subunit amino acid permease
MGPYVMHLPRWQRIVSGYFIADLTYVLLVKRFPYPANDTPDRSQQMAYLAGSVIIKWVSWISCSALGVVLANSVPPQWGLGFAGILALAGMLCSLASSRLRWILACIAGVTAVAVFALPLKLNILVAIVIAVALYLTLEWLRPPLALASSASKSPH